MKLLMLAILAGTVAEAKSVHDFELKDSAGKTVKMSDFKGKPVLLVNIATRCGYTGQLEGLEKLHDKYKEKGLQVVGIPSNDFGGQTPESNEEVVKFCKLNYDVSFPVMNKEVVKGDSKIPLVAYLVDQTGKEDIAWNFEKFLVDKNGKVVSRFKSGVEPLSAELTQKVEEVLN